MKKTLPIFCLIMLTAQICSAQTFKIGIMQDRRGIVNKYRHMLAYFETKGIDMKLVGYSNYLNAARKFASGKVDAMFAGSGVAGVMLMKELAYPVVRPVSAEGWSTYWAVIIAPKGSSEFDCSITNCLGKKICCCFLASSGEFYARSMLGEGAFLLKAGTHSAAINTLSRGAADIAIVKNRVWDSVKSSYPNLKKVGEDKGENPNQALMVSIKTEKALVEKIRGIFLGLERDNTEKAVVLKSRMNIRGFISTSEKDFAHTLSLLEKAGVTKSFAFDQ